MAGVEWYNEPSRGLAGHGSSGNERLYSPFQLSQLGSSSTSSVNTIFTTTNTPATYTSASSVLSKV